jgi:MFS family permease
MKLNYKRTILIGLAFMSLSAFWQMYDNVIPLILVNKDSFGLGDTVTGVIMALDNVLAIFLLPFFGALSDRADTRIGKRMPFILVGTALAAVLLLVLGIADRLVNLPMFIIVLFLLLLAMSLYRSPAVALMPDLTPNHLRSKGNAVINLLGAVGGAFALVMIMIFTPEKPSLPVGDPAYFYHPDYIPLFLSIVVFMVVTVAILFATISEKKISHRVHEEVTAYEKETGEKLTVNIAADPEEETNIKVIFSGGLFAGLDKDVKRSLIFLLASIFLWFTAYNAVTTAFSRYAQNVWLVEGGGYAQLLMVAMVAAIISFIPIGHIATRIGRKKTIIIGIILMIAGYFAAAFLATPHPVMYALFALIGIGWATINVNSYPMVVEMSKGYNIGKFTGTYYIFSMAAQILTPILSGFFLEYVSYRTLFPYAVIFAALALVTMMQVRHGDSLGE